MVWSFLLFKNCLSISSFGVVGLRARGVLAEGISRLEECEQVRFA